MHRPPKRTLSQSLADRKSKRKKERDEDELELYRVLAKWIARTESPFTVFGCVFSEGFVADHHQEPDEDEDAEDKDEEEHELNLRIYRMISRKIPSFEGKIPAFVEHPEYLNDLSIVMNTAAGAARSEDISSLKEPIITYAAVHSPTGEIQLQIKSSSSKADTRGWNHPLTARLMCPIQYLEQFDDDPKQTMQDLQEGRISFTADDFPAFMYAADSYDPNDMEKGLLCHEFPLAVGRHLFQAPSAALRAPGTRPATKPGQAKMHGFKAMTPGAIAYTILMSLWGICSQSDWRMEEGEMLKFPFFKNIQSLFTGPDANKDWAKKTLAFWSEQVLSSKPTIERAPVPRTIPSTRESFLAQRRAKQHNISLSDTGFTLLTGPDSRALEGAQHSTQVSSRPAAVSQGNTASTSRSTANSSPRNNAAESIPRTVVAQALSPIDNPSFPSASTSATGSTRNSLVPSSDTTNTSFPEEGASALYCGREQSPLSDLEGINNGYHEEVRQVPARPRASNDKGKGKAKETTSRRGRGTRRGRK